MAAVGAAPAGDRGGDTIAPVRRSRARVLTGAASVVASAALAAYPLTIEGAYRAVLGAAGLAAVAAVAGAVAAGRVAPVPWALATLVAEYGAALHAGGGVDAGAPLYAAALFACAELAYWSCDLRRIGVVDPRALSARLTAVAGMTALGALAAGMATAAASLAASGTGITPVVLGTLCAICVVAVLAWLGDRAGRPQPPPSAGTADGSPSSLPKMRR